MTAGQKAMRAWRWAWTLTLLLGAGCDRDDERESEPDCPAGGETCACYGNGTCDKGLDCRSGLCVDLSPPATSDEERETDEPNAEDDSEPDAQKDDEDASADETDEEDPVTNGPPDETTSTQDVDSSNPEPTGDTGDTGDTAPDDASDTEVSSDATSSTEITTDVEPPVTTEDFEDVQLIASCSESRGEAFDGAWFTVAGASSSIMPLDSSGTFPMDPAGYSGSAAHVSGTVGDYASLGHVMYRESVLFDASLYAGISFYAKAATPLSVVVGLAQENNDPTYGVCVEDVSCYNYLSATVDVGTEWTRFVVPFASLVSDPSLPTLPVTPNRIKHWQFAMPQGDFDFWVDELYFVRAAAP